MAGGSRTYEIAFALNGRTDASFNNTFKKANSTIGSLTKGIAGIASGLAIGSTLTDAVMTFVDFEQSMANVSAVTGETGENLKKLEMLARDMGSKTTKTATEAAEAISYMGLAGWDSSQIMKGIEPVLRLSEAGMLDLGRTSDLVTDSMSSLGLVVEDLPGYLDMVAQTSRKSNTNIDMLMEAMIVAGGTFKNLKVPLDEANSLLGVLANRGKKGSEAGNSLNSILVNLTSGAGQAGTAMDALGLSAFDSKGNFKGVTETLLELNDKISGLTEEQRTMYLSMIGGKTQIDTLQALLSGVSEEYSSLEASVSNSNGALMEMANTMNDTTKGAWALFLSAMDEVKIKYASLLGPTFKDILRYASEELPQAIDKFVVICGDMSSKAVEVFQVIKDNWGAIAPIIAGITVAMTTNKIATLALAAAQQKGTVINMLCRGWDLANKALVLLHSGTSVMTVAQMGLNAAMAANPVGVVCVAIGALIAIGVALWQNWDTIKVKAFELWEGIKSAFGGFGDWFGGLWEGVKSTFKTFVNFIIGGLNKIPEALNKLNFTVPDWVPGIGGKSMGFNLQQIPQFYTGTTGYNTPDTFIAGERGPELITNASGFRVFNAKKTDSVLKSRRKSDGASSEESMIHITFAPVLNGVSETNGKSMMQDLEGLKNDLLKEVRREVLSIERNKKRLSF